MKKTLILLLSAVILFGCASCRARDEGSDDTDSRFETISVLSEDESTSVPSEEGDLPSVLFGSYDDILNTIPCIAKHGGREAFEANMPELDAREQKIYQTLCSLTSQMLSKTTKHTLRCYRLDINGDGTEEMVFAIMEGYGNLLKETQTVFTLQGEVPIPDDGTLLACYLRMPLGDITYLSKIEEPLVTHAHYRIMDVDFRDGRSDGIQYEIYDSNGALVKTGEAEHSFWGYRQGDLIRFTACHEDYSYTNFFYSISQNKFSEEFPGTIEFTADKVVYTKDGVFTAQNIFDRNVYYQEFPEYRGVYALYFAEDGKSLCFRHVVEGAKKDATSVICFEELPIIRAIKICYVRTGPSTCDDVLMLSSGNPSYLRSATQDTARLLQAEPVIGGSYESDDGTVRNDWYKISYYGRECYVSADSFEVDTYRITKDVE